ncbi:DUF3830 family protein [Amaricoccus solimangrovi]|uniref:DUF3830 family protein n=1 Tax=Amaricoccus solimangrovi TaxID=2589815 RepID=A0A501WDQ5_9RHOB|nr:DUF3830 family protein [Amaricoccus solimangrovi]TPE47719.1 DUF3830 family protein [Amaricoccus solimangrovi]
MRLVLDIAGKDICEIDVWEDKVPNLCAQFREKLPMTSMLQHGKLLGDLIFFTMPIVAPWENRYLTEEVGAERVAKYGSPAGAVCFYSPRQQFCVVYGDEASDEPLPISYIGEVVSGSLELKIAGLETWFDQSRTVTLRIAE